MKKFQLTVRVGLSLLVLFTSSAIPATLVAAQSSGGGQALEIAPPVISLSANPGETINTKILLRDVSNSDLIVTNEINDFVAGDEEGTPKLLLNEGETSPYSIKSWISSIQEVTLKPKQIENLPVTINVPANAAPGGYYGVIRFTAVPPELEGTGVSLSASLGALVLLKVNGKIKEDLKIDSFTVNQNGKEGSLFEAAPLQFVPRFKNDGNIHEQPIGTVSVTDMFGNKIAKMPYNQPPHNVLPNSVRKFEINMDKTVIGNRILFGLYNATVEATYANNQKLTKTISFWVIPYRLIGAAILLLIIGFLLLRYAIKRYNKFIISQAKKSK